MRRPLQSSPARSSTRPDRAASAASITLRLSDRSESVPSSGPKTTTGITFMAMISPRWNLELSPALESTHQAMAMEKNLSPTAEITRPRKSLRKSAKSASGWDLTSDIISRI